MVLNTLKLTSSGNNKRKQGEWILGSADIQLDGCPQDGQVVDLLDTKGNFRGRGVFSASDPVSVEILSRRKVDINHEFFHRRLERALKLRDRTGITSSSYRVVNGGGDDLPGLVVDRYGRYLRVEIRSTFIHRFREVVFDFLENRLEPTAILVNRVDDQERGDVRCVRGDAPDHPVPVQKEPFIIRAELFDGQKTAYFLDHAQNRRRLRQTAGHRRGLDLFSYSGSWGMELLNAGADHVDFVDTDSSALDLAEKTVRENGWIEKASFHCVDAFDFLEDALNQSRDYNVIVIDPPAFARSPHELERARKGYHGLHYRAMRLLKPSGLLSSGSCTQPLTIGDFEEIHRKSAHDAHISCQVLEQRVQAPDHPWRISDPRARYLKWMLTHVRLV